MPFEIDYVAQLLRITSPTTDVVLQELHDFVEDERGLAGPEGLSQIADPATSATGDPIFQVEGKVEDPSNPGIFSQIFLVLLSPWQIQFWGGSGYTRISGGKLVGGLNAQPMKATGTAGDITVLESPVDGVYTLVETGVSGLTAAESAALLNIETDVGLLQSDVVTITGTLSSIDSSIGTIQTDIATIKGDVTGIETQITTINGNITTILSNTTSAFRKNQPFANFTFSMVDVTGQPASGLSPTGVACHDAGAWGPCTNAASEIGASGTYRIDLAAADLNADVVTLRFSAPGAVTRIITIVTTS